MQRVDEHSLVITDKAGGKVTDKEEVALSDDLKSLTMTVHVVGSDKPIVMVFDRDSRIVLGQEVKAMSHGAIRSDGLCEGQ
jgi:hypothetical protein